MHFTKLACKYFFLFFFALLLSKVMEGQVFNFAGGDKPLSINDYVIVFEDSTAKMFPAEVLAKGLFKKCNDLNFGINNNAVWVKFAVFNKSNDPEIALLIPYANISRIELFKDSSGQLVKLGSAGNFNKGQYRVFRNPDDVFKLHQKANDTVNYYLQFTSFHPVSLSISVGNLFSIEKGLSIESSIISLYIGIILTIFFYNLFLFISTLDKAYFYYILYICLLGLAQITLSGYSSIYLWGNFPDFNRVSVPLTTCLAGIGASLFTMNFLRTKLYTPYFHFIFITITILFIAAIIFSIAGSNVISYGIFSITSILAPVISIVASFKIARKGYRPAYFYFVSFLAFSIGLVIFILRNENILPNNNFTTYILYLGSAIETILLSFALADKINSLRKEKEESQAYSLRISKENEKLIGEQNIVLEQKVAERTDELQNTNLQLNKTLGDLKDAQTQLVEAEKMASLGQLTAGIAHEINNPINFVKSNIRPLQLDIDDLFEIIDQYNLLHDTGKDKLEAHLESVYEKQQSLGMDYVRTEIK